MQGLELSEKYFIKYGLPLIEERFGNYASRIAAGLVGDGSECFGFDDELSRDHDWGPSFCLWVTAEDFSSIGKELQAELNNLPKTYGKYGPRNRSTYGKNRVGVFEINKFYWNFIGIDHVPDSLSEWMRIPENRLAVCTNGKVFCDKLGAFTEFRDSLLKFYPEDVRLKKIAARCMTIAQYGQYNFQRCVKRKEYVAAKYAEAKFCADTISLIFLLNKEYTPFFKWMHRKLRQLPHIGEEAYHDLDKLVTTSDFEWKHYLIEKICSMLIEEMTVQGLTDSTSDFLLDHGPSIQKKIKDNDLKTCNTWLG